MNYFKFLPEEVLTKKIVRNIFPFSQNLFWDSPIENIDIDKHKNYIIERVLMRGDLEDFYYLLQIYSREEIIEVVKKSKVFDHKLINFCSLYFGIPKQELNASSYYN